MLSSYENVLYAILDQTFVLNKLQLNRVKIFHKVTLLSLNSGEGETGGGFGWVFLGGGVFFNSAHAYPDIQFFISEELLMCT